MEINEITQIKYYQGHMVVRNDERINNWTILNDRDMEEKIEEMLK